MHTLPLTFRLRGRTVLMIGGGAALAPSLGLMARAGAQIRLVAAHLDPELADALDRTAGVWQRRSLAPRDFHDAALALVATGSDSDDREAVRAAQIARVPVAVAGRPELSDFELPSAHVEFCASGALAAAIGEDHTAQKTLGPREQSAELGKARSSRHNQPSLGLDP